METKISDARLRISGMTEKYKLTLLILNCKTCEVAATAEALSSAVTFLVLTPPFFSRGEVDFEVLTEERVAD